LIHLVEVDHVQHRRGPRTADAYWSVSHADDRLRDLVEAARKSPFGEKTTFVIASDHGFFPIEQDIRPNVALRDMGLLQVNDGKLGDKQAYAVSQGGGCMVYILDGERKGEIAKKLTDAFAQLEGVEAVFTPEQFREIGQSTPDGDPKAPDLWLAAKSGYSFTDDHAGETPISRRAEPAGTHGFLPHHADMLGALVISGYGVKPGTTLGRVSNLDVAPTIAALLGVKLPSADGKPLQVLTAD
jgi:predicted AlkP superfamily pyrophosphatase or phosphodiesterase